MYKKKVIRVPSGAVERLTAAHGCTKAAVYNALNYNSNSIAAQAIRRDALGVYGGVTTQKVIFSCG